MRKLNEIKPFLLHPMECVRNFAGKYFYNLNHQPPGLVDQVFKAMDKYGDRTCIGLLASARQYTWSEEQLLALLDRAAAAGTAMSDRFNVLGRQYEFLLLSAPPSFFEEHKSKILHDCSFSEMNRKILERFFAMRQINIDTLLDEMMACARSPNIVIDFDNMDYFYGLFLGRQICHLADSSFLNRAVGLCADSEIDNGWPAILLHETLRGGHSVHLEPLVPQLAMVDPLGDAVLFTLKSVSDDNLARYVFDQSSRLGPSFEIRAFEALSSVKHDCVAEYCLQWLQREKKRGVEDRSQAYLCLAELAHEETQPMLERALETSDYAHWHLDIEEMLLINEIIRFNDLTGDSEAAEKLADREREGAISIPQAEEISQLLNSDLFQQLSEKLFEDLPPEAKENSIFNKAKNQMSLSINEQTAEDRKKKKKRNKKKGDKRKRSKRSRKKNR